MDTNDKTPQQPELLLMTVDQFAHAVSLSRALIYKLITRRAIKTVKFGRLRRIPSTEIQRLAATAR